MERRWNSRRRENWFPFRGNFEVVADSRWRMRHKSIKTSDERGEKQDFPRRGARAHSHSTHAQTEEARVRWNLTFSHVEKENHDGEANEKILSHVWKRLVLGGKPVISELKFLFRKILIAWKIKQQSQQFIGRIDSMPINVCNTYCRINSSKASEQWWIFWNGKFIEKSLSAETIKHAEKL